MIPSVSASWRLAALLLGVMSGALSGAELPSRSSKGRPVRAVAGPQSRRVYRKWVLCRFNSEDV